VKYETIKSSEIPVFTGFLVCGGGGGGVKNVFPQKWA